jgi:hypothetical protein
MIHNGFIVCLVLSYRTQKNKMAKLLQLLEDVEDVRATLATLLANKDLVVLAQVASLLQDVCLYTRNITIRDDASVRALSRLYRPATQLSIRSTHSINLLGISEITPAPTSHRAAKDVSQGVLRQVRCVNGAFMLGTFTAHHMNTLANICPNIVHLSLDGANCDHGSLAGMASLTSLISLTLRHSGCNFVGLCLPPSLQRLVITGWVFEFKSIAVALKGCPRLRTLELPSSYSSMPESDYLFECLIDSCSDVRNLVAPPGTSCQELYAFIAQQADKLESLSICIERFGDLVYGFQFPRLHTLALKCTLQHGNVCDIDSIVRNAPNLLHLSLGGSSSFIHPNIDIWALTWSSAGVKLTHLHLQGVFYTGAIGALVRIANAVPSITTIHLTVFNRYPPAIESALQSEEIEPLRKTCRLTWTPYQPSE